MQDQQQHMTNYACWKCNQKTKVHPHRNKCLHPFPALSLRCSPCHHDVIACADCGRTSPDWFYTWARSQGAPTVQDRCIDCWAKVETERARSPVKTRRNRASARA
ncbi:hypothetical protein QKT49_gp084 [Acanthamoeba castellanii medusavirus]|uniref:Uncharacterized protein n=1 Tax=Acanthamoeba castellanii medusavirus J1 TaxID=3114988 RepID=A0A3T1CWM6_9VIRU|nr:hypothetical protein QKT49_gp084 [Acanthamoeba castellanii medusavirus]BBI30224.1 hypothetical protein [Acanthamoeba castellanii medusavirus J1]